MSGSRPVLLLMDFQHGIVERLGAPSVTAAADQAVKGARAAGVPVMFVRVAFRPGYPEVAESNSTFARLTAQGGDGYQEDHPATQVHAALAPLDGEPVILKRRVSAFSGSDLDMLLRGSYQAASAELMRLAGVKRRVLLVGEGAGLAHLQERRRFRDKDMEVGPIDACRSELHGRPVRF